MKIWVQQRQQMQVSHMLKDKMPKVIAIAPVEMVINTFIERIVTTLYHGAASRFSPPFSHLAQVFALAAFGAETDQHCHCWSIVLSAALGHIHFPPASP